MDLSIEDEIPRLAEYEIGKKDLEATLDVMPMYGYIRNTGQHSDESPLTDDGILDEQEKPDPERREGESRLGLAYDDFQYHFAGMIDADSFCNNSDDEVLDLPEENRKEAAGALFGASYALFRNQIVEEGDYPAGHSSFKQDIDSQEERELFLEEGAVEIRGEVKGPWGYDHEKMNEVMDADVALQVYNDVAEEIA